MRKADYLTLAKRIRQDVERGAFPALGETHEKHMAEKSASLQAQSLARYLAEHLSVDSYEFLKACGVRPT